MKMTAREYLTARGWHHVTGITSSPKAKWYDPTQPFDGEYDVEESRALGIQRARDAQEERAAWDRYFAHATASVASSLLASPPLAEMAEREGATVNGMAAASADKGLAERRARFHVEITDEAAK